MAIKKSIKTIITDKIPNYNKLILPYHLLKSIVAATSYRFPAKNLTVIAVTGTNGKTSTAFFIWKMLNSSGYKTGILTTVAWGGLPEFKQQKGDKDSRVADEDGLFKQTKHMTTVDSFTLNRRIKRIVEAGAKFIVLETTSHALTQFRTFGIPIDLAILTNITHEHLDYHKTFENYRNAKRKLFKKSHFGIINADDHSAIIFKQDVKSSLSYGIDHGILKASEITLNPLGVSYLISEHSLKKSSEIIQNTSSNHLKRKLSNLSSQKSLAKTPLSSPLKIETNIPGRFSVYNSLAAVAVGLTLNLSYDQITQGIRNLKSIEGRMNTINLGQNFTVIVDYAHTPDAFQKVFDSVYPNKHGKIISLFGGAGRRDESTRKERGKIASKYSDICIITEDDSRDENPKNISDMFVEGCLDKSQKTPNHKPAIKTLGKDLFVDLDRKSAIQKAINLAHKGDIVLILGKGHEKTILKNDEEHPFEDLIETKKAIKNKLKLS